MGMFNTAAGCPVARTNCSPPEDGSLVDDMADIYPRRTKIAAAAYLDEWSKWYPQKANAFTIKELIL
jgi:hypothetical protein